MAARNQHELYSTLEAAGEVGRSVAEVAWVLSKSLIPVPRTISGVRVWTTEDVERLRQVFEDLAEEEELDEDEDEDSDERQTE